jgi:hypothetical protein
MISPTSHSSFRLILAICCSVAIAVTPFIATRVAWAGPAKDRPPCNKMIEKVNGLCGTETPCKPDKPKDGECSGNTTTQRDNTECVGGGTASQGCEDRENMTCTETFHCVPGAPDKFTLAQKCVRGEPVLDSETNEPIDSTETMGVIVRCKDMTKVHKKKSTTITKWKRDNSAPRQGD